MKLWVNGSAFAQFSISLLLLSGSCAPSTFLFLISKRQLDRSQGQLAFPLDPCDLCCLDLQCSFQIARAVLATEHPAPCPIFRTVFTAKRRQRWFVLALLQSSHKAYSSSEELGYWHLSSIRRTWGFSFLIPVKNILNAPWNQGAFALLTALVLCQQFTVPAVPFNFIENILQNTSTQIQSERYPVAPQNPPANTVPQRSIQQRNYIVVWTFRLCLWGDDAGMVTLQKYYLKNTESQGVWRLIVTLISLMTNKGH